MTTQMISSQRDPAPLEAPSNATRTSDYEIREDVWAAYAASLDRVDDLTIALEVRARAATSGDDLVELDDFIRAQGYDPADLQD